MVDTRLGVRLGLVDDLAMVHPVRVPTGAIAHDEIVAGTRLMQAIDKRRHLVGRHRDAW